MTEPTPYDKVLMLLHEKDYKMPARAFESLVDNPIRILDEIHRIDFLSKEDNLQATHNNNTKMYNYSINTNGINFIETLPTEFNNRPYSYYLELQRQKEEENKTKGTLEMQKLRGDVDKLANDLIDYDSVKNRLKRTEIVAWVSIGLLALKLLAEYTGCKAG